MDASAEPATKANLLSWVKIAVAVAVIRCKPPGDSALKHAERICSKFWTNQLSLQTNFQQTKAELSHLQKQLTEEKNVPRGTAEKCHNLSPMQVLSGRHHDLTPPPSVEYVAGQVGLSRHIASRGGSWG
ncbi:uncharacterized protein LOC101852340 [Aplysia californica]|uniref:Uncharacterized protein LOC101852340 n=1 Tax=Aplysia californica TaxID=6500 RepID=A0ABM0JXL8_APLCA|nr:uncharacterized protein LOC101852340 [Aplysia californica]